MGYKMRGVSSIFLLIFTQILRFISAEDAIKCSSHCSLDDSTLDCWQKTENYYLNELIETVNNLTKVEVMIDRWRIQNNEASRINDTVADILNRITTLKMNRGPMNDTYINDIMNYTTTEILNWAALKIQASSEVHYSLECPVPEDYVNTLWIYMFACACIVLALTLIYVVIHVHKLKGEIKKQKRLI